MRKFLLSAIALLMTATMLAVGNGSGKSQANAIDFDWDGELFHGAGNTSWYCIKLSELNKDVDDPTVAIYLTNPGNEMAHVELTGSAVLRFPYPLSLFVGDIDLLELAGTDATQTYDIAGKKHVVWTMPTAYDLSGISDPKIRKALADAFGDLSNVSLVQLVEFGLPSVDLKVYSTQQIVIAADVYETSEIVDDACTKADDFDWAGETVAAGETWFYLDLNAVKNSDKKLNFVVENNGANDANVSFDLYADCPASAILLDYDWAILSGDEVTEALGRFFLDQMTRDYVYLKLTTDQSVTLKAEEEVLPPPVELFNPSTAPQLEIGKEYSLHGETVLQVNLAALKAPKGYKTVCHVVNPNGVDVNLKQEIAYTTPVTSNNVRVINLPVAAGAALEINVPNKNIENVKSDVVYFRLTTAEPLTLVMEHEQLESSKPVDPSKPSTPAIMAPTCEDSYAFDWNSSIKQKALMTKWYELDITSLKKNEEHVQLSFTNHTESVVVVMGSILSDCNSKDTIPFVCPVPAGMQISKVIDYSLLATSPISKAYVSLTMMPTTAKSLADFASVRSQADLMNMISLDFSAEIEVKAKRISALVDPSYCEATYQTLKEGVEYHIEPGKTHWYRVTGDFLKDMGLLEKLTIFNNGKSDANVTLGATIDCQYGIATTITQTVPKWFDVTSCYPSGFYQLARLLTKKEITEYYLSVKSDQPMLFGFGLDHGTMLGCDDALRFDWAKGATINRLDPQWFNFDLNDVKGTGNHLKLTFTNTTDEIVWLATMTSLTCPLKVVAPTVMPVLPGMSVDKVIDYSFVATTPVNNVYVAVIASGKLELGAKLIDATVTEPVDCINHVEVVSGEKYIHKPGTTWYKFSNALLANMGEMPRFTFENLSANTITLSAGMTVDCKYGILTKAKAKIPATVFGKPIHNREFAMRIPREFFQLVRKHIDSDVTELMFQLTADNPFSFSINMQADNACANAETFGWKGCYDLPANQDVWYQVNVAELMASNKPISVALYNKNKFPVEIEAELAPSCPVLFSVTEYYTAPALDSVKVTVSAKKIQSLLGEYSKYINNGSTCYVRLRAKGDLTTCLDTVPPTAPDVDTPCQDVIVEDTVVACNSYVWHGTTYKASGVYTYEETTANCEEAEVLDWSQPIKLSEFTEPWYKVCVAEVIANESDFSMTFDNDMETTDLTLELHYFCSDDNDGFANSITKTVAPGLYTRTITWDEFDSWIGTEYDTLYLHNVNADCKNIEKLHLTINKTVSTRVTETACGQYEWNGKVYTKSGSYKDTLVAANGCDSIVTLRLTVNPVVETVMPTETETICASDLPYAWRDTVCAAAGTYTSIEEDGCNRTVYTLTLNVLDGADATYNMTETICADKLPYTWSVGKGSVVFDAAGTKQYFDPLECGYTATYNLTLNVLDGADATYNMTETVCADKLPYTWSVGKGSVVFDAAGTKQYFDPLECGYTATYNLTLNVDACTPPTPQDPCLSAIAVEWDDVVVVPADADVWYAVDITTAIAAGKDVKLTVKNTSSEDTKVYVEAYSDCPATDFLGEMNATIKAGQTREMVIDYAKWLDGQVDLIYMHVVTVGGSVDAEATPITPVVPPTPQDPCLSAIAVDWTDAVTVPANADVWYAVDITTAIAAGKDVKLTVKNTSSEDTKVYVEAYSDCPATDFLGEMNATIKAGKTREIVIDYAKWLDGQVDVIYMHVVTVGGSLDAEATPVTPIVPPTPQDPCLSAIAVNWDDEVTVPANADVWYAVDITTAIAAGKDVKLTVKNTSSEDTKVYVEAYSDCPATDFLGEMNATIKAGKTREIVIDYAKWLDGQVDVIYMHVVTVGGSVDAEATPVTPIVPPTPQDPCLSAIAVNWDDEVTVPANADVWYAVDITTAIAAGKDVKLTVKNTSSEDTKVYVEAYSDCPATDFLGEMNATIKAGKTREIVIDYAKWLDGQVDVIYMHVVTVGGSVDAEATPVTPIVPPTPQDPCLSAIAVNWDDEVTVPANADVWYAVDITTAIAAGKDVKLTVKNTSSEDTKVYVEAYSDCPATDFLGEMNATIKAGKTREIVIDYAKWLDGQVDVIYMHVVTVGGSLDAEATPVTPIVPPTPQDPCLSAIAVNWDDEVTVPANADVWYAVDITTAIAAGKDVKLTVKNTSSEDTKVYVEAYSDCPATDFLGEMNATIKAGKTREIVIDYAKWLDGQVDVIYMHVVTVGGSLDAEATPVTPIVPPTPQDPCLSAIAVNWDDEVTVPANADVWYAVDITTAIAAGKDVKLTVKNTSSEDTKVYVEAYSDCPATDFLGEMTATIKAGQTREMVIDYAKWLDGQVDLIYVHVVTVGGSVDADAELVPDEQEEDACLSAIAVDWTDEVTVPANADVWYAVDITTAIAAGKDVKLTVKNTSSEDTKVYVEAYSDCPATDFLGEMNATIKAGQTREMVIDYAKWLDGQVDLIYVHVVTVGGSVDADAELVPDEQEEDACLSAIAVDWTDEVTVPANADVWYAVDITTAIAAGKDVKLTVKNTSSEDTKVYVEAYSDCPATDFLGEMNATIKAGKTREMVIDYAKWLDGQVDLIYVHVVTVGGSLDAEATPVDCYEYKTITDYICDGATYVDPVTGEARVISSLIASTQTWNDTVVTGKACDSIYSFVITPIVAPEEMTVGTLNAIGAAPVLKVGSTVDVTGTVEAIKAYYEANDTEAIADVVNVTWIAGTDATLTCENTTHSMVLFVEAGCDFEITTTLTFPVEDANEYAEYTETACDKYVWHGETYTASGDYTFTTTTAAGCERVEVLHLTINKTEEVEYTETACDEYVWHGETYTTSGDYTYEADCRKEILHLTINKSEYEEYTETACDEYVWHGETYTASGDYTYTTTTAAGCERVEVLHLTINKSEYEEYTETACDEYVWHGETYTASGDYTYTTTTAAGCERVEVLHLTINKSEYEEYTETACDEYVWHGETYTASGDYTYTTTTAAGCERVEVLHLTINKSEYEEYTETACDEYVWHGETYTESGDYTYTTTTASGCERVEVLHLTINKSEYEEYTETACDEYVWHGETYTESGDYTYTTTTAAGCERVEVLHLTINKSEYEEYTETACDEYVWHGETYTASGDYTYTTTTAAGCERVEVLHLTINKSEYEEYTETACDEYVWHGETYTASGDYTYTTTTAAGCERVEVLHLTINKSEYEEYTESACESYVWHGETYTESGDYTYTTTTAAGCERVEVLHLTINVPTEGSETINLCPGETYTWNGDTYDKAGTYTTTLTNAAGCDSVATLVITIPDADNFVDYDNVPAVSKYGNRLLVINLNAVDSLFGWVPAESDVQWFKINGAVDAAIDAINRKGDDEYVGNGYYYNFMDGSSLVDDYYALILHQALEGDCQEILRTTILSSSAAKQAPQLLPTIANPYNNLRVLNLNPSAVSEIRVYNTTGELLEVYTSTQASEFILKAASMPGYYMVEVQAEGDKATLRYIVK